MSSATELKRFQVILLSNISLKYWKAATRKEHVIYNTKQMKWDHLNLSPGQQVYLIIVLPSS